MRIKSLISISNDNKLDWLGKLLIFLMMLVALTIGIRFALGNNVLGIDFFTFWMTGKASFIQHQDPYSESIVQQIQLIRLNRLALPGEDQLAFAYPLYMLFLVLPFAYLAFPIAQALWLAIFILLLVTSLYLLFSGKHKWAVFSAPFFYPFVFSIILGNFDLLICLIILMFFWAHFTNLLTQTSWQITLGILLAFAIGKPQFSYLVLGFCLLIAIKYKYWRLGAAFILSLFVLITASFIVYPAWFPEWISRLREYSIYHSIPPLYQSIIHLFQLKRIQNDITVLLFALLIIGLLLSLINWWRRPTSPLPQTSNNDKLAFTYPAKELFILGLIGVITYGFHPTKLSYEQLIMFIPFFLWTAYRYSTQRWAVALFWWAGMAVSWIAFFLNRTRFFPQALFAIPIIFFSIWLLYLLFSILPVFTKEKTAELS